MDIFSRTEIKYDYSIFLFFIASVGDTNDGKSPSSCFVKRVVMTLTIPYLEFFA